jgi:trypsin
MRVLGRHRRPMAACRTAFLALTAAGFTAALLAVAAGTGASGTADRLTGATRRESLPAGGHSDADRPFGGVAAVGALFTEVSGRLGRHFCTASVVDSPGGDIAVSAAHCFTQSSAGQSSTAPGPVVFVPGYDKGAAPYGVWRVTRVYTEQAWQATQDPDDDVAFLRLAAAPDGIPVEDVTGAERLGTGWPSHTYVQVIGYPDVLDQPVWCANWTDGFSPTQLQFDCDGFTHGTSGGPFLAAASGPGDEGTVVGVIGGYQQGGDTPEVSYSVAFGPGVASLYRTAVAGG